MRRPLIEACSVCGGWPLHRLGCPLLTRIALVTAIFFGGVTIALMIVALAGGSRGNLWLGVALTAFFGLYWWLSRSRASH